MNPESSPDRSELERKLDALRETYITGLPDRLDSIRSCWAEARQRPLDHESWHTLHRLAHSLAGSGPTFGFKRLGETARSLERQIKSAIDSGDNGQRPSPVDVENALTSLAEAAETPQGNPLTDTDRFRQPLIVPEAEQQYLVYLVEDDHAVAAELTTQIRHFGYKVKQLSTSSALLAELEHRRPDVIVADIILPEGDLAGIRAVQEYRNKFDNTIPVVFISTRTDFEARLESIRAGASAYFTKPVNAVTLVDRLDKLARQEQSEPPRILIVDDSLALADFYKMVLEQAGMQVKTINDPKDTLAALSEFTPELIIMDMYMPGCTGLELAQIVRQQESYTGVPIVFLSTETNVDKQLVALRHGGDDFLEKPIRNAHLVSAVTNRIQRYRELRRLMSRDSLTGLLNHSHLRQQLDIELARSQRQESSLSYALIDIDHFKTVNDRFGHPTGDRVIKGLTRMLQQRLRRTDIIGRYGGEEFAVILPDTLPAAARLIIDQLRESFANIQHQSASQAFTVTFSAGIACCPPTCQVDPINERADQALYAAKTAGRNCVRVAGE